MHWMQTSKSIICPSCRTQFSKEFLEQDILKVKPTLLYSTRYDVDGLNTFELEKLSTPMQVFAAKDCIKEIKSGALSFENQTIFDATIPQNIFLKVGAQVMLRWNLNIGAGLANGSRGVITQIPDTQDYVRVRWYNNLETNVTKVTWEIEDERFIRTRSQIPLILAWSMTIHKCQGSTLDYVVCDLGKSIFAPGQAYVALSRVRTIDGLLLSNLEISSLYKYDKDAIEFVENNSH
jgi:ATP-dependent DNA helicase PIF1